MKKEKKRPIFVEASRYQEAMNMLDKAGFKTANKSGAPQFDLLTMIITLAVFGLAQVAVHFLNLPK